MALAIEKVFVENEQEERALRRSLEKLGAPPGEDWVASVTLAPASGAWHVSLCGPARSKADHVEWEIVESGPGTRYWRALHDRKEQNAAFVKCCARRLLWDRIQFRENPIKTVNSRLAQSYEEAVWRVLCGEDMAPVEVRFGVWREGFEAMKIVCKVKYVDYSDPHLSWSWWSTLVNASDELVLEMERALDTRRERYGALMRLFAEARVRAAERASQPRVLQPAALRRRTRHRTAVRGHSVAG
jgi:hypothetical protein